MSFYTDVILRSTWSQHPDAICKDPNMLEPGTRAKVQALITDAVSHGHTVRLMETYRSQARQHQLFQRGFTKLSHVGCHGFGVAADLGLYNDDGKYETHGEYYAFMQALCAKHNLISGIDWGTPRSPHNFRDPGHVQNVPVFRQPALFAGDWYPASNYNPIQDQIDHGVKGATHVA